MEPQKFVTQFEHRADPAEIRRTVDLLFPPDSVVELRVMKAMEDGRFRGTIVGYFDGEHRTS